MLEQPPATPADAPASETDAVREGRCHTYFTHRIPWYVRFIWLLFWVFAVAYVIRYLFPALQVEISNPP